MLKLSTLCCFTLCFAAALGPLSCKTSGGDPSEVRADSGSAAPGDALVKKYGYDKALPLNLDLFRREARKALQSTFGQIAAEGQIIHKDNVSVEPSCFFDFNRAYYIAKVNDERFQLPSNYFATYMISPQGDINIGFAEVAERGVSDGGSMLDVRYSFPGFLINFQPIKVPVLDENGKAELDENGNPETKSDIAAQSKIRDPYYIKLVKNFPDLEFYNARLGNAITVSPPKHDGLPTAKTFQNFSKMIQYVASIKEIHSIQPDGEAAKFIGTEKLTNFGEGNGQTIDLNALRTITLKVLREGQPPCAGLVPYLARPFGTGQRIELGEP